MNRRSFLSTMLGAGAFALDPERALWVPGAKLISIPVPRIASPFDGFNWLSRFELFREMRYARFGI